jgi:hypothetical protein
MSLELTPAELEFLAVECRLISNRKTLAGLGQKPMFLHVYDDCEQMPTIKLDEYEVEDTLPGLGSLENEAEDWETLGEVPFPLVRRK